MVRVPRAPSTQCALRLNTQYLIFLLTFLTLLSVGGQEPVCTQRAGGVQHEGDFSERQDKEHCVVKL